MGVYKTNFGKDNDLVVRDSSGSTTLVITSTGGIRGNEGVDTVSWSSLGLSPSTATAYGITYIDANSAAGDPSTSPVVLTMAAPIAGVRKTIIFDTTAAYINTVDVLLSGATLVGTSGDNYIYFSSLGTETQSITLVGITTALWGVESVNSTLLFFRAGTGIRSATAARTS